MDGPQVVNRERDPSPHMALRFEQGRVSLDSVLITEELSRRHPRPPDYEAESRALVSLGQEMANSPHTILQKLAETAMGLCKSHSAGISLLESDAEKEVFRWNAAAGRLAGVIGGSIARDLSPCGIVLDRNAVLLFGYPERHYDYPIQLDPPIVEALLVPFHVAGEPIGTIWVIAHDESRKFDTEDARILQDLGKFASSAYQMLRSLDSVKASEERLQALVNASSEVNYRMSADWSEMRQLGGGGFISDTAGPKKGWMNEYIPAAEQAKVWAAIHKAINTGRPFELEHRVQRADGTPGWTLSRAVPILNETGEITEWFGAASDVTARKENEEALLESKDRLRTVIENIEVGLIVVDPDSLTFDWNRAARRIFGYSESEMAVGSLSEAEHLFELRRLDGTKVPLDQWPVPRLMRGESVVDCELLVHRKPDNWEKVLNVGGILVRDSAGKIEMGLLTLRDVTDLKTAQKALVRNEKLASVGRMATTIAHEINNPLAAATNAVFIASNTPDLPEFARTNLELADQELRRIAHITKQTLGFYREDGSPTPVLLPELVNETLQMYTPQLRNKSLRPERRYRGPSKVFGIAGELRQVISNLIANSIDAMGNKGALHVRTTSWNGDKDRPMVRLTVADTGSGISPENLKQIFEPFFTTKEVLGTGLGLWVTKELVKKHGGMIRVRSRVGRGTAFSIWLPSERRREQRTTS